METKSKNIISKILNLSEMWAIPMDAPIRVQVGEEILDIKDEVHVFEDIKNGKGAYFLLKAN